MNNGTDKRGSVELAVYANQSQRSSENGFEGKNLNITLTDAEFDSVQATIWAAIKRVAPYNNWTDSL